MQSRTQPWNALTVLATFTLAWIAGCAQPTAPASPPSNTVAGTTSNSASNPAAMPSKDELKQRLSPLQFRVTQESGTERAFANEYWDNHRPGIYVDIVDGTPLFSSLDKFDSGTGWPSFTRPLEKTAVKEVRDTSHGMVRVEARSARADSHLGHVFDDGPEPTGQRYCMNSASLRFVPVEQLAAEGLGRYLPLFGQAEPAAATPDASQAKPDSSRTSTETAMLAGGCFWGMEDLLRKIPGVLDTECGYTGGHLENPKYDDTHDSKSGHAEAVKIVFDPTKLKFEELLVWFFKMHDPTTLNRQGNDRGTQYRSAIFYADERQKEAARQALVAAEKKWKKPITTTLEPAGKWWPAEAYHQDYLQKNPGGYTCHFLRD